MRIFAGIFCLTIAITALAACQSKSLNYSPQLALQDQAPEAYTLASGDLLSIKILGEEELSGDYIVNDQGQIDMPLIGAITLNAQTLPEATTTITQAYSNGFLVTPDVSIQIQNYRPFYILGGVNAPGKYVYEDGLTILNAIAIAGGFSDKAHQDNFEIIRKIGTPAKLENKTLSTAVLPGDVIHVREGLF